MTVIHLIQVVKTSNRDAFLNQKEIGVFFDKKYVIDVSEEKKSKSHYRMTKTEIIETNYLEIKQKIEDIMDQNIRDEYVMILEEDEQIDMSVMEKIKKEIETQKEVDIFEIYEIEEREVLGIHTKLPRRKIFKIKEDNELLIEGTKYKSGYYAKTEKIEEEYLKLDKKEKNNFEFKKMGVEQSSKKRAAVLRKNNREREAMTMYERMLEKEMKKEEKIRIANELFIIYLNNEQYKKIEELSIKIIEKKLITNDFYYFMMLYSEKVDAFKEGIDMLNRIEKEELATSIIENNKMKNLKKKYELAKKSMNEELIIRMVLENIEKNSDDLNMHIEMSKIIIKKFGKEVFDEHTKELYKTEEEKKILYNVMNELGLYGDYMQEIKKNINCLENKDIAKMYVNQHNNQGKKQAIEFSKIHSKKIYALIYNLSNKTEEISETMKTEKTLTMLENYINNPTARIEDKKYKKHFYVKTIKEAKRIKNNKLVENLLLINDYFEEATKKEIAIMYKDEYEYEEAIYWLEKYIATKRNDKEANKLLALLYEKTNQQEKYIEQQIKNIKQEPYNKYQLEKVLNQTKEIENEKEKEKIIAELEKIQQEEKGTA